jgi:hypothetical protein
MNIKNKCHQSPNLMLNISGICLFSLCFLFMTIGVNADTVVTSVENLDSAPQFYYGSWSGSCENGKVENAGSNAHSFPNDYSWVSYASSGCDNTYTFNEGVADGELGFWYKLSGQSQVPVNDNGHKAVFSDNGTTVVTFYSDPNYNIWSGSPISLYCQGSGNPIVFGSMPVNSPDSLGWRKISMHYNSVTSQVDCMLNGVVGATVSVNQPPSGRIDSIQFVHNSNYSYVFSTIDDIFESRYPSNIAVSNLKQLKSDSATLVDEGAVVTEYSFVFSGRLTSPLGNKVKLQIEVKPAANQFTGTPTAESGYLPSGEVALANEFDLPNGSYHWRARVVDTQGNTSAWQAMSSPDWAADFTVDYTPTTGVENLDQAPIYSYGTWSGSCNEDVVIAQSGGGIANSNPNAYQWKSYASSGCDNTFTFNNGVADGELGFWYNSLGQSQIPVNDNKHRAVFGAYGIPVVTVYPDPNNNQFSGLVDLYCQGSGGSVIFGSVPIGVYDQTGWNKISVRYNYLKNQVDCLLNDVVGATVGINQPPSEYLNSIQFYHNPDYSFVYNYVDDLFENNYSANKAVSNLGQFKADGATVIAEGGDTSGSSVVFKGTLASPSGNPAQMQVEVQPVGTAFTGTPTATSVFSSTWGIVSVSVPNLASGQYHWQARVVDSQNKASAWQTMSNPAADVDFKILRNPVILIPGFFGSWGPDDNLALDPILHTYDNLWAALELAGYEKDKTLFAFPYNWRQSNASSGLFLKQKIDQVKNACSSANLSDYDCSKIDLVAHSMGGIVARSYIEGDNYQNDVDQLIFLATPQQGAPMAYLAWEGGEAGPELKDSVMWNIIFSEAESKGYLTNFSYFRGLPMLSLKELLPTYNYLKDKGSDSLRSYPDNYPRNDFLENLNNSSSLAKLTSVKILNIVADDNQNDTIKNFRVVPKNSSIGMWEYGYPENYSIPFTDHGIEKGSGDDTVPAISNKYFNNFDQAVYDNSSHLGIVTDAQKSVVEELTGSRPNQEVRKNAIEKIFMARIFSPADFLITAPDGKRIGKNFTNGQEINEIPGAYYSGKFATIPNPIEGQYKVELQGTGNGDYKLSISGIDDATTTNQDFSGQITTGATQDFKIDYSSSSPDLISALQPQDVTPPILTVSSPLAGSSFKHSDKMIISYQAVDDFSGMASTVIKIDNKLIFSITVDLFDYQIGTHTLSILASDKAGNSTEKKINFSVTADIKSTISDIKEIYKRGWLKNSSPRDLLIGELNILDAALKISTDARSVVIKKIADTKNNPKLSIKEKDKLIVSLNKDLAALDKSRQGAISLDLVIFEKTLNAAKKSNYLNQNGYDILKSDLDYLLNNL